MAKQEQSKVHELTPNQIAELRIKARLERVGTSTLSEIRRFFPKEPFDQSNEIVPQHLFVPTTRRTLLVPAEQELNRVLKVIESNTTGIDLGEVTTSRGLQVLIALMQNQGVHAKKQGRLLYDNPKQDSIISQELLEQGIKYLQSQIQNLPEQQRTHITLLDIADVYLIQLTKGRTQRAHEPAHKGKSPPPRL